MNELAETRRWLAEIGAHFFFTDTDRHLMIWCPNRNRQTRSIAVLDDGMGMCICGQRIPNQLVA